MYLYEYLFIFLTGTALGLIVRYILGYKKRAFAFAAINIITGGLGCVISIFTGGVNYMQIFLSGAGGIVGESIYLIFVLACTAA